MSTSSVSGSIGVITQDRSSRDMHPPLPKGYGEAGSSPRLRCDEPVTQGRQPRYTPQYGNAAPGQSLCPPLTAADVRAACHGGLLRRPTERAPSGADASAV